MRLIAAGNTARGTSLSNGAWQSGSIGLKGESTKLIRESTSCFGITRTY